MSPLLKKCSFFFGQHATRNEIDNSKKRLFTKVKIASSIVLFPPFQVNPLSPSIHTQILQTDLHTFP